MARPKKKVEEEVEISTTYNGNINIKGDGVVINYTKEQTEEYIKCATDIVYFIEKYCKVMTIDKGFTNIELRPYQKRYFEFLEGSRFSIVKWPRQAGKTQTSVLYILWKILFSKDQVWYFLANKLETAREAFSRLKDSYESLPFWLQTGMRKLNESTLTLSNGSKVTAAASSKSSIRGRSGNIMWDEAAFVNNDEEFFTSVFPVISSGTTSKFIMVSTPNGMSNTFYHTYKDVKDGRGDFQLMEIEWNEIPGRDEEWRKKMIETLGQEKFEQEFMTSFMAADGTLLPLHVLEEIDVRAPVSSRDCTFIYEDVQPEHQYAMTVDVARGLGRDFSVFSVMDCTTLPYRQVAVYRNNEISPMMFPYVIDSVSKHYNDAKILVEINDLGGQVADILRETLQSENILWVGSGGRGGQTVGSGINTKPGVKTTPAVKTVGCNILRALFETKKIEIWDHVTFTELTSFVMKGGSYEGENGSHDDHVMTLVLFAWLTDQKHFQELYGQDTRRALVEGKMGAVKEELFEVGVVFIDNGQSAVQKQQVGNNKFEVIDYTKNPYGPRDELTEWFLMG